MGDDIVTTTEIEIGDVQQGRIKIEEAVERIARTVDGNAIGIVKACKKSTKNEETLHGKDGKGGLITDVAVVKTETKINRRLIFGFMVIVAIELILVIVGYASG